jgi:hypothetical protein
MLSTAFKSLLAATVVVAGVTIAAPSASAETPAVACPSNRLCAWTGSIQTGRFASFYVPDNSCVDIDGPRYSAYNRQSVTLVLSEGTCASPGASRYIRAGERIDYLLPNGAKSASRCSSCRVEGRGLIVR